MGVKNDACLLATLAAVNADNDSFIIQVRDAAQKDDTECTLTECNSAGCPANGEDLPLTLRPCWQIKDDVTKVEDIILLSQRMVMPHEMRKQVLKALHVSHQGQVRILRRARRTVYWPHHAGYPYSCGAVRALCRTPGLPG